MNENDDDKYYAPEDAPELDPDWEPPEQVSSPPPMRDLPKEPFTARMTGYGKELLQVIAVLLAMLLVWNFLGFVSEGKGDVWNRIKYEETVDNIFGNCESLTTERMMDEQCINSPDCMLLRDQLDEYKTSYNVYRKYCRDE